MILTQRTEYLRHYKNMLEKMTSINRKYKIGILVTHDPITLVNLLYDFGEIMDCSLSLDLIVGYEVPKLLEKYYNICRFRYPGRNKFFGYITEFIACIKYVWICKPDALLQYTNPHRAGLISSIVGRLFGIRVIVTMSGESYRVWKIQETLLKKIEWFLGMHLSRIAFKLASKVIAFGPILRSQLISHGIKPERISLLPPALSVNRFKPGTDKFMFKRKLGISTENKVVLYVGRLDKPKGTDLLISIIKKVLSETSRWTFAIVGTGYLSVNLKKIGSPRVKLFNEVSPLEIDVFYKASDLIVFPSRTEGLPRVILEALASGIPVVSSGVGEIPTYVSNICDSVEDYVEYIVGGEYKLDSIPEVYLNGNWKKECLELLRRE